MWLVGVSTNAIEKKRSRDRCPMLMKGGEEQSAVLAGPHGGVLSRASDSHLHQAT